MPEHQALASYYRAALLLGLTSGEAVIAWADDIVSRDANAPKGLFDLTVVPPGDLSELRHALQPLTPRVELPEILPALFDRARADLVSGRRDAKDTITVLAQARSFLTLSPEHYDAVGLLQNDYMLANAGVIGTADAVVARLHTWLAQFAGSEAAFLEEQTC